MELPEHACISCACLFQSDGDTISRNQREGALTDENNLWNNVGINYQGLACCKGNMEYSVFITNNMVIDIRNSLIKPNLCDDWIVFQDISSQDTEPGTANKLVTISIIVAKKSLAIAFAGMIITFIVTLIIWYVD